jgi:hypothetical protein
MENTVNDPQLPKIASRAEKVPEKTKIAQKILETAQETPTTDDVKNTKNKKWFKTITLILVALLFLTAIIVYIYNLHSKSQDTKKREAITDIIDSTKSNSDNMLPGIDQSKAKYLAYIKIDNNNIVLTKSGDETKSRENYSKFIDAVYRRFISGDKYILFTDGLSIKSINKTSKEVVDTKLPIKIIKKNEENIDNYPEIYLPEIDFLNGDTALVVFFPNELTTYPYVLDVYTGEYKESKSLIGRRGQENPGDSFYHALTDNLSIINSWSGDQSSSFGTLYLYNIKDDSKSELLYYTNGRNDSSEAFVGIINEKLITASHTFQPSTEKDIFHEVYQTDPITNKKTVLFLESQIPNENHWELEVYDKKNLLLTVEKEGKLDNGYLLNIDDKTTTEIDIDPIYEQERKFQEFNEFVEINRDFLVINDSSDSF